MDPDVAGRESAGEDDVIDNGGQAVMSELSACCDPPIVQFGKHPD
jgi:hypothetical protein